MKKNQYLKSSGFTLIELLISMAILSFFAILVAQLTIQSTKGLDKITNDAVTAQSVIRFSNLVKYDFSGSKEVYIHSNSEPSSTDSNPCSSFFTQVTGSIASTAAVTTITSISSTAGLVPGMTLTKISGTGAFGGFATVTEVLSTSSIKIFSTSTNTVGAITFNANNSWSSPTYLPLTGSIASTAAVTTITSISSTAGLVPGMTLTKISGTGAFGGFAIITSVSTGSIGIASLSANSVGVITFTPVEPYVRGLFTLLINEVLYTPGGSIPSWIPPSTLNVGYELRQDAYGVANNYKPELTLWRVECKPGSIKQYSKLLSLGRGVIGMQNSIIGNTGTIGVVTGTGPYQATLSGLTSTSKLVVGCQIFSTPGTGNFGSGIVSIRSTTPTTVNISSTAALTSGSVTNINVAYPVQNCYSESSTSSTPDFYAFEVPYLGNNSLIQKITTSDFQKLRSRIDK